jgi:hypothetical protein
MNSLAQVKENLASAEHAEADSLSAAELSLYERVVEAYRQTYPVRCTACGYCMPCPNGVNVPQVFQVYNESSLYADPGVSKYKYGQIKESERADKCVECGHCEEACPQKIPIIKSLAAAHEKLKG